MHPVPRAAAVWTSRTVSPHVPPRGTRSAILVLRLQRNNFPHRQRRCLSDSSELPQPPLAARTSPAAEIQSRYPRRSFRDDELRLLLQVVPPGGTEVGRHAPEERFTRSEEDQADGYDGALSTDLARGSSVQGSPSFGGQIGAVRTNHVFKKLQDVKNAALAAEIASPVLEKWARLSPTAFSEVLRSLDPLRAGNDLDDAKGIHVSAGLAEFTPLGHVVDKYGVRKVYKALLEGMIALAKSRAETGHPLLLSDYKVLLRCAGAASDPGMAKRLWHTMEAQHHTSWRDSESYIEFLRARFLTDPLYAQNDLARFRVRPINLHRQQKQAIPARALMRLKALRRATLSHQLHSFGQDPVDAEQRLPDHSHLSMRLRKRKPIMRVFQGLVARGIAVNESLLSTLMVAFAWTGSLTFIKQNILRRYWGIEIRTDKQTGEITVSGPLRPYPRDSPLYPTERLLRAVVQSFCSNAEVATAFKLVDFIAQRCGIPVPQQVWFDLLEWTYIMASKPASTEWKILGYPDKVLRPQAIHLVWDTMTAEPYSVRPGFEQYDLLIKTLIHQRRFMEAGRRMREWQHVYQDALNEVENAYYEHVHAVRRGLPTDRTLQRWMQARARKYQVWYRISLWCHAFLRAQRSPNSAKSSLRPDLEQTLIPQLVEDFRAFMPERIEYRVAAGLVSLQDPAAIKRFRWQSGTAEMVHVQADEWEALSPRPLGQSAERTKFLKALSREKQLVRRHFRARQPYAWTVDSRSLQTGRMPTQDLLREFT